MLKLCRKASVTAIAVTVFGTAAFAAAPEPAAMLAPQFQPKQQGVSITTPTGAEIASCKVELVSGPGSASGWMLKDAKGQPVRKFVSTKGARSAIDVWSFYLDGQEAYREISSKGNGKADQFRWYGPGGMRWGVDVTDDGKIDGWMMISAEEVSQELLKAIATRDIVRFRALLINEKEIASLELPAAEADKLKQQVAQALTNFNQAAGKCTGVNDKSLWMHLEVQPPQCVSAETMGGKNDLVHYKNAAVLFEGGGKHDWVTLGELVQVGRAWRMVSAPVNGNTGGGGIDPPDTPPVNAVVKQLVDALQVIDQAAPQPGATASVVVKYNLKRAEALEKIVAAAPAADREQWVKQLADSYSTAAQNSPPAELNPILAKLKAVTNTVKDLPALAGYVVYREISAEYSAKLQTADKGQVAKIQEEYCAKLRDFVTQYPKAEDAPDAALQVAMVNEFMGKESEAKTWYGKVVSDYPGSAHASKGAGAVARLDIEGKPFVLQGTKISGGMFNMQQTAGKVVVVYYWASWNGNCASDFNKLTKLIKEYESKGVELVTVSLDSTQLEAKTMLDQAKAPGAHVWVAGGLDSPLAVQQGIMVLPQLFLVGKDGKVVSRTVQINTLEDEVKKLTDK